MLYDEYDPVFKNGDLTHLMITKKGNTNKQPKHLSYGIYKLLKSFLDKYNIHIGGGVMIGEYEVTAVTITPEFDIKNEPILKALYEFKNARVNIQLAYRDSDADVGAYAFWYDLDNYQCTFEKYVYGDTKESIEFDNLEAMLHYLKKRQAKKVQM